VAEDSGVLLVREDTIIKGEIRNCRQAEIYGYVEGDIAAKKLMVHQGGQCYGTVKSETAEVQGTLQGDVAVTQLINIRKTGSVSGNVRYGRLAMEEGANLSAEVRNVPPTLGGDLELTVDRGRSTRVTLDDLNAFDPDDTASDLTFTVSNAKNGFVAFTGALTRPTTRFTLADLQSGKINFTHDGTGTGTASFDVVVTDHAGATSGAPQTVRLTVRG
jgi:cytoskeletal protein CcmA (bactofilin family)